MKLADDPVDAPLSDDVIAARGALLYREAMLAYEERVAEEAVAGKPLAGGRPAFIIGSEVPIPGGEQEDEGAVQVTKPQAVRRTIEAYQRAFSALGFADGLEDDSANGLSDVIAIVVQPGVEFGSDSLHIYRRGAALALVETVREIPQIVMEGHSTDYQPAEKLREMVEDGVGILKVGPALTFALREALFDLAEIEEQLLPPATWSNLRAQLDEAMVTEPKYWQHHYRGSEAELKLDRSYSLSDRARYYIGEASVVSAIDRMLEGLSRVKIPVGLAHQYFPNDTDRLLALGKAVTATNLLQEHINDVVRAYEFAAFSGL